MSILDHVPDKALRHKPERLNYQIKSNHLFADTNNHCRVTQNGTFNNNKFCWLSAGCDARCLVLVHGEILNIARILLSLRFEKTP